MSSQLPTPAQIIEKLEEYSKEGVLDCMDDALLRIVRAAVDGGSLTLAEIVEIVTYEMCIDGDVEFAGDNGPDGAGD